MVDFSSRGIWMRVFGSCPVGGVVMRDLFDGIPNLASKRVTVPVTAIPQDNLLDVLRVERESLFNRIKPKTAGVVELRLRLKDITRLIMQLELIERRKVIL